MENKDLKKDIFGEDTGTEDSSLDIDKNSDEYDGTLGEADIPIKLTRKKKSKKKKKKRRKRSTDKQRKKLNLFELMSATGENGSLPPLRLFGFRIKYWPIIAGVLFLCLLMFIIMSNGRVTVVQQDVSVVGLSEDLEGYRILVLTDLNSKRFGDEQSVLMRTLDSVKYDIILCVGDMVGSSGDPEPFYEFLESVSKPNRVYFTCGDADPGPYVSVPREISGTLREIVLEDWILGAIERGANYIDYPTKLTVGDSALWLTPTSFLNTEALQFRADWKDQMEQEEDGVITGLDSDYNSLPLTSYRYLLSKKFYSAVNEIKNGDMIIGLSHIVPGDEFIISAASHDGETGMYMPEPELIVSGHYCGGVWNFPVVGAIYVPNRMLPRYGWFPDQEDVKGLSRIGESQVFLSAGLSTTSALKLLPFRLLCNPEVNLLKLTASLPESMLD